MILFWCLLLIRFRKYWRDLTEAGQAKDNNRMCLCIFFKSSFSIYILFFLFVHFFSTDASDSGDVSSGALVSCNAGPSTDSLCGSHNRQHSGGTHTGALPHTGQYLCILCSSVPQKKTCHMGFFGCLKLFLCDFFRASICPAKLCMCLLPFRP